MTRNSKSRVMTIANKLVGKGYSRRLAMVKRAERARRGKALQANT